MPVSSCTPWRSVWLPRAVTVGALVIGLPLFLRSPPWCDITLYQMAARNLLHGGVHYRDLFDTNLPGFVWVVTALSAVFGPNVIAIRVVDLLVVLGVVVLLDRLMKWGGATPTARWWAIAGIAVFYPFTSELSHAQRDTWMALPGLAAVVLRVRRGRESARSENPSPRPPPPGGEGEKDSAALPPSSLSLPVGEGENDTPVFAPPLPLRGGRGSPPSSSFRGSFYEGLLWGAAVWMKPHIVLMALVVWVLTAWRLAADHPRPWRAVGADLLGNLLGGLTVGLPGVVWMVASGSWDAFYCVFTEWNPRYMKLAQHEFPRRAGEELYWFPPWSLGLIVTVPLALISVLNMPPWTSRAGAAARPTEWLNRWLPRFLRDERAGPDVRFVRGVLGGLYLVWAGQAFFVQRGFEYVHVPETLLMLGVWAVHRWAWVPVVFTWLAVSGTVWLVADHSPRVKEQLHRLSTETRREYLPRHPLTDTDRLRLWPQCWRFGTSDAERYALWDKLRLHPPHEASIGWEELSEVAAFLRAQNVKDREVVAWFNSPHAIYLMLDRDPGFRYMHVYTAISISIGEDGTGELGHALVLRELRDREPVPGRTYRYVISDLEWAVGAADRPDPDAKRRTLLGPPRDPPRNLLPADAPFRNEFPFNQPTVFRSRNGTGRYIVHRIESLADGPPWALILDEWSTALRRWSARFNPEPCPADR